MTKSIHARQQPYFDRMVGYLMHNPPANSDEAVARVGSMLEDIYEPRLNFWQELESDTIIRAFKFHVPLLSPGAILKHWGTFREVVENHLYVRQFDERCAMRLLALPADGRPSEQEQVYDWLMADFATRSEDEYAEYLDSDCEATRAILGFMHRFDDAGTGAGSTVAANRSVSDPASGATNGAQPV
ncbi:hypothetical protein B0G71_0073 [Paraburkholderia sp. BL27I4N3]|uniref:hypothetical protein n=1 Tax=Paraburkholderia sp. BL27I4N3 TaxID=1938805 RepID=UPI000E25B9B3|nr:hypothetical protein [Paraburkholderia sp. BL27I4N3]REE17135.1 hypothetical protein B0G71_0073 [Paraburkholderia sp. BL27I4N3]